MAQNHVIFLVIISLVHLSTPSTAVSASIFTLFSDCLRAHSNTSNAALLSQSSAAYTASLASGIRNLRFSSPSTPKPLLIFTPHLPSDVSAALLCCRALRLTAKIRSGGHDFEGLSSTSNRPNFLILDLTQFRSIHVDPAASTAVVQSGATIGELYFAIAAKTPTLAFPAGLCPTVGVGGHLTGGGYGTLIRKHGLSVDHIIDAEMVVADGRVLNRKSMGEELFWAIRGGGGSSFGVILSYTVRLVDVPATVTVFSVEKMVEDEVKDMVYTWQTVMKDVDNNLFMRLLFQPIWYVTMPTQLS